MHRPARRPDRGDGTGGGDQRGLLQPDPGDRRRSRAGGVRDGQARRVRRGHRHPPPRLRARRRFGHRARRAARRADPSLRGGGRQGPELHGAPQPDHAGLRAGGVAARPQRYSGFGWSKRAPASHSRRWLP